MKNWSKIFYYVTLACLINSSWVFAGKNEKLDALCGHLKKLHSVASEHWHDLPENSPQKKLALPSLQIIIYDLQKAQNDTPNVRLKQNRALDVFKCYHAFLQYGGEDTFNLGFFKRSVLDFLNFQEYQEKLCGVLAPKRSFQSVGRLFFVHCSSQETFLFPCPPPNKNVQIFSHESLNDITLLFREGEIIHAPGILIIYEPGIVSCLSYATPKDNPPSLRTDYATEFLTEKIQHAKDLEQKSFFSSTPNYPDGPPLQVIRNMFLSVLSEESRIDSLEALTKKVAYQVNQHTELLPPQKALEQESPSTETNITSNAFFSRPLSLTESNTPASQKNKQTKNRKKKKKNPPPANNFSSISDEIGVENVLPRYFLPLENGALNAPLSQQDQGVNAHIAARFRTETVDVRTRGSHIMVTPKNQPPFPLHRPHGPRKDHFQ